MTLSTMWNLSHAGVVEHVRKVYGIGDAATSHDNPHRMRRERMATRLRLYRDDGERDFYRLINKVFKDEKVRKDRTDMVEVASHQNITRDLIDEVASLYDRPAVRTIEDSDANDLKYRDICALLEVDDIMQEGLRLTALCNEVLVWSTVNSLKKPKLRLVTPDAFDAIPLEDDATELAAVLFDRAPSLADKTEQGRRRVHYELWDEQFRYLIDAEGRLVDGLGNLALRPAEHGQGRIPGFLMHRRKPMEMLLDARHGKDITSAHLGVFLINCMTMRLAKSQGERQPILSGDMANVATRQSLDGETPLALPPGVIASMLDSKTSPEHYLQIKNDIIEGIEDAYGVDYNDGAEQSGSSFVARRSKLTELREEQRRRSLLHEKMLCELLGHDPAALTVDYREQAIPVSATEEVSLLQDKLKMGLDSPIDYLMRKDPDLTRDEAQALFDRNIADYANYIKVIRELNAPADATAMDAGNSPRTNGVNNDGTASISSNATRSATVNSDAGAA